MTEPHPLQYAPRPIDAREKAVYKGQTVEIMKTDYWFHDNPEHYRNFEHPDMKGKVHTVRLPNGDMLRLHEDYLEPYEKPKNEVLVMVEEAARLRRRATAKDLGIL